MRLALTLFAATGIILYSCKSKNQKEAENNSIASPDTTAYHNPGVPDLPKPYATPSANVYSDVMGWTDSAKPTAPAGFTVTLFAADLENPRWAYQAPDGSIFVAESNTIRNLPAKAKDIATGKNKSINSGSANRITVFRDTNGDGIPDSREVFLKDLNQPFGMLVLNNYFYVANTDKLIRFPWKPATNKPAGPVEELVNLPAGGYNNHWTRNIITDADSSRIFISVGSGSNNGENGMDKEFRRANILVISPDGKNEQIYASGLRNPVGMDWAPGSNTLWAAVNERDELGDELVPDYLTSVKPGGFYGWPYAYYGQHEDPRLAGQRPDLVAKTIVPDIALGSHTASLGLGFYKAKAFPEKYHNGAFIAQHGSWNRSSLSGYKVVFVPFSNGQPSGPAEDFLTGFIIDPRGNKVHGRPTGITMLQDGSMLVTDDAGNCIWRISFNK